MTDMAPLRARIDEIDREILRLIGERLSLVNEVVRVKTREGLPVRIPQRIEEVMDNAIAEGEKNGVPQGLVRIIWAGLIEETCQAEERLLGLR